MICEKCGQWIEDGSKVCSNCGAPVNVGNTQNTVTAAGSAENAAPAGGQPALTKKEFYMHPNISYARSQIRSAGIICYVVAGISLVFSGIGAIIDVLLIVGLGLGIQLGKSRACAIILTVYGVINTIYMTIMTGSLSGWWSLLAGIYAIIYTFKYQSAWAEYQKTGNIRDLRPAKNKNK